MKTRRFTLLAAIVMMGAVTGAAGQPARGEKNGNHEKNNRKELRPDERREVRGMQERKHYSADRVITPREMNMQKNAQKKGNDVRQIEKRKLREVPGHPKGKYMVGDNKFSNPPGHTEKQDTRMLTAIITAKTISLLFSTTTNTTGIIPNSGIPSASSPMPRSGFGQAHRPFTTVTDFSTGIIPGLATSGWKIPTTSGLRNSPVKPSG